MLRYTTVTASPPTRSSVRARLLPILVAAAVLAGAGCSAAASGPTTTTAAARAGATVAKGAPVPSSGCTATPGPAVTDLRQDIQVGGVPRWYLLTTPSPATPGPTPTASTGTTTPVPRPLVVDFHGLAEGATLHAATSRFGALGQRDGFVAVFPNGTGSPAAWDTGTQGPANADLDFVADMLRQVESTHCIDTSRVYASGFSDGSFMVSLVACTMSDRFAAIAAVSGLQLPSPCRTTRRVPVITFHGTADPILFFNGGVGTATLDRALGGSRPASGPTTTTTTRPADLTGAGYPATVKAWAQKDGCGTVATDTTVASQVILRTYRCPPGTDVEFYIVLGGGHAWPGSTVSRAISALTGYTTFEIDATDLIWQYFQRFRL